MIIAGDFNIQVLVIEQTTRQKVSKDHKHHKL